MNTEGFDIIVVGAGVAGGIFAASQPDDRKILIIERDLHEPDRIVGELMQPGGIMALKQLNLDYLLENIDAQIVNGYNIIKGEEHFTIEYNDVQNGISGLGLRNGKFLTNIREDLKKRKNVTLIQGNVTELIEQNEAVIGVRYVTEDGSTHAQTANLTLVCDGPMSILREELSKVHKKVSSYFIGLIIRNLQLEHPFYGHMIISGDSPILVYPVETNAYRILIDYPGTKPPRIGKKSIENFKEEVIKILPKEMVDAFIKAVEEDHIQVMPNHMMKNQAFQKEGVALLGDSFNMRHPITGGGMTACFNDIICINKSLTDVDFDNKEQLQKAVNQYYLQRDKGVETINILANALYKVFVDKDLKDACFEYLQQGGDQANGPLAILAGINKDKKSLLKHFYKVSMQHPIRFITDPQKQIRLYKNSKRIILSTLKEENITPII